MNLTITVEDDVLKKARMRALEEDTSVNAVLREYLEAYAGVERSRRQAIRAVLAIARESRAGRGDATWTRDELHER